MRRGKATPAGADLQRDDVGDQPERQRDREHHDEGRRRARHQPVEDLGLDQLLLGDDQLHPHQRELGRGGGEHRQRGGDVELADDLVVGARGALDPRLARLRDAAGDDLRAGRRKRSAVGSRQPPCSAWLGGPSGLLTLDDVLGRGRGPCRAGRRRPGTRARSPRCTQAAIAGIAGAREDRRAAGVARRPRRP